MLQKFLEIANSTKSVIWFVIPGTFIKGKISHPIRVSGQPYHTVELTAVTIQIGAGQMQAERLIVPVDQVIAYGSDDETLSLLNLATPS